MEKQTVNPGTPIDVENIDATTRYAQMWFGPDWESLERMLTAFGERVVVYALDGIDGVAGSCEGGTFAEEIRDSIHATGDRLIRGETRAYAALIQSGADDALRKMVEAHSARVVMYAFEGIVQHQRDFGGQPLGPGVMDAWN